MSSTFLLHPFNIPPVGFTRITDGVDSQVSCRPRLMVGTIHSVEYTRAETLRMTDIGVLRYPLRLLGELSQVS